MGCGGGMPGFAKSPTTSEEDAAVSIGWQVVSGVAFSASAPQGEAIDPAGASLAGCVAPGVCLLHT